MIKRIASIALAICLCFALITTTSFAASNPYPQYNWYNNANDYQIACTWYAWKMALEQSGVELPKWSDGGKWYDNAQKSGYSIGSSPKVGSIACWSTYNSPPNGHVAYVTGVNTDGSFNIVEGGSEWPQADSHGLCSRTVKSGKYWPDQGFIYLSGSSQPTQPSVSFSPWENGSYTYIRETDASIGQEINVSGGTCTDTGMYLYDANGKELAHTSNGSYYYRIYFKINAELGYTLTPGTQYKYRFYAIVNGQTYWSDMGVFKTSDTSETAPVINASVNGTEVDLSWNDTGASSYYIYVQNKESGVIPYSNNIGKNLKAHFEFSAGNWTAYVTSVYANGNQKSASKDFVIKNQDIVVQNSISLDKSLIGINPGETQQLIATFTPSDAVLSWSSSDSKVATVNSSGLVTAVAPGTAVITVSAGTSSTTCTVNVNNINVKESVNLYESDITVNKGSTKQVGISYSPADATPQWSSNNTSVATVSNNGVVTGVSEGTALITVRVGSASASCNVKVTTTQIPVITTQTLANAQVGVAYSQTLNATSNLQLRWGVVSTDTMPPGLYISSNGVISGTPTAKGEYSFRVVASNSNGSDEATFTIKVTDKASSGVHFTRTNIYHQDQFTDVKANQWFTNTVASAFELGLMKGQSSTVFDPYGDVTIAEAITMASRIHSIYSNGSESFVQSGKWYQVYLDYAYQNGIISYAYYNSDVGQKATRAQFAEIFANALPAEALPETNNIADNSIPDVTMKANYSSSVYKLYRAGILAGSDANGTFNAQTYITRAEAATIVARMAESDNRVSFILQ